MLKKKESPPLLSLEEQARAVEIATGEFALSAPEAQAESRRKRARRLAHIHSKE